MAKGREGAVGGVRHGRSLFTEYDVYLFREGRHHRLFEKLGSHRMETPEGNGTYFAVWAPNAARVSVIGSFNRWDPDAHPLKEREDGSGIWEGFVPGVGRGDAYKYRIHSRHDGFKVDKGDPFAFRWEKPPGTASVVWDLDYSWGDGEWRERRKDLNSLASPFAIYEAHLGSWRTVHEEGNRPLSYREAARHLPGYAETMGFTHVEFLPLMEHPFGGSWGYQVSGYFAPTSRYGDPQDLMFLVDSLHRRGIGVILDWVPSHFVSDEQGLVFFDGTHLFEHADPKKGYHPDWHSYIFNYGRNEVKAFLISNAVFWFERFHADGLRVDAVASMLYLDYSRKEGEWVPNRYGGRENLEAVQFLKEMNEAVYGLFPEVQTIAEESTAWPLVSRPPYSGGLGFGMKWNLGWMHDALEYFAEDPVRRGHLQDKLTFSIWYAFRENFVLPLSHDEVVHGKGSLLAKMPGDEWRKFANLRLLIGFMYAHPGKKLLFMGAELGEREEWSHERSLSWDLLERPFHGGLQRWVKDLNRLYRAERAFHGTDFDPEGFEWVDFQDREKSVVSFLRKDPGGGGLFLVVCNFTPVPRYDYRVGVHGLGYWEEVLNSDALEYGGSGHGNFGGARATPIPFHKRGCSLALTLPPLGVLFFKWRG